MLRLKLSILVIVVFEMQGLQEDCCLFGRFMKGRKKGEPGDQVVREEWDHLPGISF